MGHTQPMMPNRPYPAAPYIKTNHRPATTSPIGDTGFDPVVEAASIGIDYKTGSDTIPKDCATESTTAVLDSDCEDNPTRCGVCPHVNGGKCPKAKATACPTLGSGCQAFGRLKLSL